MERIYATGTDSGRLRPTELGLSGLKWAGFSSNRFSWNRLVSAGLNSIWLHSAGISSTLLGSAEISCAGLGSAETDSPGLVKNKLNKDSGKW